MSLSSVDPVQADFVIKFEGFPKIFADGTKRAPPGFLDERAQELERLMARLRDVGLVSVSRAGPRARGQVLVFVHIEHAVLQEMRQIERSQDFLHGVVTAEELSMDEPFKPAERVRYTHKRITAPYRASSAEQGAGITARCAEFPHVMDMMPLHDSSFNQAWIKTWSHVSLASIVYGIDQSEIDKLRDHFGVHIAMYFAFLNAYSKSLVPMAVTGFIFWLSGLANHHMYACLVVLWAIAFVEYWHIRERMLAVRWGMTGVSSVSERNSHFTPRTKSLSPITGMEEEVFENWRHDVRSLLCVPVTILFLVFLVSTMAAIFLFQVVVDEVYDGPAKSLVALIPTILFSTCIPLIQSAWRMAAQIMTNFENHATVHRFQSSLTSKIFGMQSVVTYGILALTTYMYLPFGEYLINQLQVHGYLDRLFAFVTRDPNAFKGRIQPFHVSPTGLHDQLFAMSVTQQLMNTFTEVILPILWRHAEKFINKIRGSSRRKELEAFAKTNRDQAFLERVQNEFDLDVYDEFTDYAEMATQLGVISLWSVLWPLAPVMSVVNNFFELRSDAFKLVVNMRRPIPRRVESIGSWSSVLSYLAHLSFFTNFTMLFIFDTFKPDSASSYKPPSNELRKRIELWLQPFFAALLLNYAFSMVPSIVRYVLERTMWQNSAEDVSIRRRLHQNRVALISRFEKYDTMKQTHTSVPTLDAASQPGSFWHPSSDTGVSYIASAAKAT
ncbi:cortical ER protein involved in ER-plasma membrane tethering [Malassezia restricta]|uniref:cortical ER protein involved in ER-plasma membrane tethering n=1 Tax=Malassezia restricta TaxID=76775 RepID=UPI000DD17526|nr:cortical ER protein involved in ER-plasma membrane tethering [Malassezia restricta]AXA48214.1 cortical ER protein involved in ER-plasma membrane tethering [Malassezia restricta]